MRVKTGVTRRQKHKKEFVTGLLLGGILGLLGFVRIVIWQEAGIYDYYIS